MRQPAEIQRSQGIVLRTFPYREQDMILRILTPTYGKISAMARSAKKSNKRFASSVDVFDRGACELRFGRGSMASLLSFESEKPFRSLRTNLDKLTLASFLCEAFDYLINEASNESDPQMFDLLSLALGSIDEATDLQIALRATFLAILNLLSISGFMDTSKAGEPSAKGLLRLALHLEQCAERELKTKSMLSELLERYKQTQQKAAG